MAYKKILPLILFFVVILNLCVQAFGQAQKQENQDDETIKLSSTLVQIPVVVSDKGGRYITDLKAKDFHLYEDGVEQEIAFFGSLEQPFHVALLLDSSGSTAEQLELIKRAAEAFIDSLRPSDEVMVISFNESVQVHCEMTGNRDVLKRAVRAIRPGGFTQVYEAVYTAVWEKLNRLAGRKAVLLFSDGIDNASSEIEEEDTLDAVIESEDVIIYPIRYNTRADVERRVLAGSAYTEEQLRMKRQGLEQTYQQADQYLEKLADLSGGKLERADSLGDLTNAFSHIASELRQQYLLGYYPAELAESDNDRKIRFSVNRQGVRVRSRGALVVK
ncbi:MAG: VWA domain-containing protein [Acidobacteria bacterium]|nr:VWA domain-containing protein [Acidobacteriota bacterium]